MFVRRTRRANKEEKTETLHSRTQFSLYRTVVFPARRPAGRQDVINTERWITEMMESRALKAKAPSEAARELLPILEMAMQELIRQVSLHCAERGSLLERIWQSHSELFDHILLQIKTVTEKYHEKITKMQSDNQSFRNLIDEIRAKNKEKLNTISSRWQRRFHASTERYDKEILQLKAELEEARAQAHRAVATDAELRHWLPNIDFYRDSGMRAKLPTMRNTSKWALARRHLLSDDALRGEFRSKAYLFYN